MMHTRYFDLRDTKGQQKIIEDQISAAADILRQGGLVGIPTETQRLSTRSSRPRAVRRTTLSSSIFRDPSGCPGTVRTCRRWRIRWPGNSGPVL